MRKNPIANVKIELLDGKEIRLSQFAGKKCSKSSGQVIAKSAFGKCRICRKHTRTTMKTEVIAVNLALMTIRNPVSAIKRKFKLTLPIAIDKSGETRQSR